MKDTERERKKEKRRKREKERKRERERERERKRERRGNEEECEVVERQKRGREGHGVQGTDSPSERAKEYSILLPAGSKRKVKIAVLPFLPPWFLKRRRKGTYSSPSFFAGKTRVKGGGRLEKKEIPKVPL